MHLLFVGSLVIVLLNCRTSIFRFFNVDFSKNVSLINCGPSVTSWRFLLRLIAIIDLVWNIPWIRYLFIVYSKFSSNFKYISEFCVACYLYWNSSIVLLLFTVNDSILFIFWFVPLELFLYIRYIGTFFLMITQFL